MYKIQKCVALPASCRQSYPFMHMEVSDSFLVPYSVKNGDKTKTGTSVSAASHYWTKKLGYKFITRNITKEKGIRVWRIE